MAFKVGIINISDNANNILLTDNLTIELLKIRYNWILNASVKNAVIGEDSNGLVWYMGEWMCGDWEGGTWYSGIWHNGNWKGGKWYSYLLDKSMILFNKFIVLDKNETYSEFRNGTWFKGNWYDGIFGYNEDISECKTWGSINDIKINTAYWKIGEFYDGIFKNSIWESGNFHNGSMYNSFWVNGRFYKGTFNKYVWINGTWYGGDFLEGDWNNGNFAQIKGGVLSRFGINNREDSDATSPPITKWRNGIFYSGEFHSGLNIDLSGKTLPSINHSLTQWFYGNFNNGNWYGGSFMGGNFNNGNWYGGVFNPVNTETTNNDQLAIWNNGKWYNGLWVNGTWKSGHFYGGIWMDGIFEGNYLSTDISENVLINQYTTSNITLPSIQTIGIGGFYFKEAIGYGKVTNSGGSVVIQRGIYWALNSGMTSGTNALPTVSTFHYNFVTGSIGNYSVNMTNLSYNTKYYYGAYAINSKGITYGSEKTFTTPYSSTIEAPYVVLESSYSISSTEILSIAHVVNDGGLSISDRGICWSDDPNTNILPVTGLTNTVYDSFTGDGIGEYEVIVPGLTMNKTYYFRAFAKNTSYIGYSSDVSNSETNTDGTPHNPVLTLETLNNIGGNVDCRITITDNGNSDIAEEGVCWGVSSDPDIGGDNITETNNNIRFIETITGLDPSTTYYIRSFAKNASNYIGYSAQKQITTPAKIASIATIISLYPTSDGLGLLCKGHIDSNGLTITGMGFYYGLTSLVENNHPVTLRSDGGDFTDTINGLQPGTTYYVKAYAINSDGTVLSEFMTQRTLGTITQAEIYLTATPDKTLYEIGTSNTILINVSTTMNTETIFKEVNIYQDSLLKYTQSSLVTEFSKSITFEPVGETITSIPSIPNGYEYSILSTIKAVGIFGNPIYRSEKNILIYSVYPFLTVCDTLSAGSKTYYSSGNYYNQSKKVIEKLNSFIEFSINIPSGSKYAHIGYYYKYGSCNEIRINNIVVNGSTPVVSIVKSVGMQNIWSVPYIIQNVSLYNSVTQTYNFSGNNVKISLYFNNLLSV